MDSNDKVWQTKLAARLHDPAEKALVLLRDPAGHEGGTSSALARLLGYHELDDDAGVDSKQTLAGSLFRKAIPTAIYRHLQRADWWAAAADRPQWPMDEISVKAADGQVRTLAVAPWAQVRWTKSPELIHPLTGDSFDLKTLADTEISEFKDRSYAHFDALLSRLGDDQAKRDWRKALLTIWRFGPDLRATSADTANNHQLGALWELLPADTRVPEHSIWDHLDLTSAFAGAFAADPDGEVSLLALSIGPVQPFIAAARKMDDLWAGSHLLSRLSWEVMRPIAETLGPDAVLFPRLRGIPQVDLWLRDQMDLPDALFTHCEWNRTTATDANPLFSAALPNRCVAVVPRSQARAIAERCSQHVRKWLATIGQDVVARLLKAAGLPVEETTTPYEQMSEQLAGFPEVHWAAVPFSLIRPRDKDKQRDLDTTALSAAMAPFFGCSEDQACGFLDSPAWRCLGESITLSEEGRKHRFFAPNPGVLYPAVFDLAERVLAAAKSLRHFRQQQQHGWRESLTGESEWLCSDRQQLQLSPGQREDTLWTRVSAQRPAWARKGEHLGALSAIKRLWPNLFAEEAGKALAGGERDEKIDIKRFVVSTHTMALAQQLDHWLARGGMTGDGLGARLDGAESVALPRRLTRRHARNPALADAKRLPGLLERARETDDDNEFKRCEGLVRSALSGADGKRAGRLETYYALLMMDGDRMGAILAGDPSTRTNITYRDSFHSQVRRAFDERALANPQIRAYGEQSRAVSPGRHLAISAALNDFSQTVVRHVVEEEHLGRLIYAGGDDVLAMLPVSDLLPSMQRLREAYSGQMAEDTALDWHQVRQQRGLHCRNGFAMLNGRLMRMMGQHATASTGAVIAHHQAPLAAVLRELRLAEQRAKNEGDRNAFSLAVIKRSGGALYLTDKWGEPVRLLNELIGYLRQADTSRRAVYHSLEWLKDLPEPESPADMLRTLLSQQLQRQSEGSASASAPGLARRIAELSLRQAKGKRLRWVENLLAIAEFLAREIRSTPSTTDRPAQEPAA